MFIDTKIDRKYFSTTGDSFTTSRMILLDADIDRLHQERIHPKNIRWRDTPRRNTQLANETEQMKRQEAKNKKDTYHNPRRVWLHQI
jgi:hypothetical protein